MNPISITADRLFDGSVAIGCPALQVRHQQIAAVGRVPAPLGSMDHEHFDFPDCTILPGLIDTHVHLVYSAADTHEAIIEEVKRDSDAELLDRALANARAALHAGLTTIRDCGGKGRIVQ